MGQRCFKFQILLCARMNKANLSRMEALTLQRCDHLFRAIDSISSHGMAQERHVNSNLMGPPSLQAKTELREALEAFHHPKMSYRMTGSGIVGEHCHLFSIRWMTA